MKLRAQGIPELWVGSERPGESPDRRQNILQRFGFRTLWRCLAYCGKAATLGGWHPSAPSLSPWHGGASGNYVALADRWEVHLRLVTGLLVKLHHYNTDELGF
jgi:hypothetical protein